MSKSQMDDIALFGGSTVRLVFRKSSKCYETFLNGKELNCSLINPGETASFMDPLL